MDLKLPKNVLITKVCLALLASTTSLAMKIPLEYPTQAVILEENTKQLHIIFKGVADLLNENSIILHIEQKIN